MKSQFNDRNLNGGISLEMFNRIDDLSISVHIEYWKTKLNDQSVRNDEEYSQWNFKKKVIRDLSNYFIN